MNKLPKECRMDCTTSVVIINPRHYYMYSQVSVCAAAETRKCNSPPSQPYQVAMALPLVKAHLEMRSHKTGATHTHKWPDHATAAACTPALHR